MISRYANLNELQNRVWDLPTGDSYLLL